MKKVTNLFVIGLMTLLLSINSFSSLAQAKGSNIKKGSVYIGYVTSPQQIAAYGTPAWLFSTMSVIFIEKQCIISFNKCAYSINMYTGGLGEAMYSQNTDATSTDYLVKDGKIYIWDSSEGKPKDESGYLLIFKINADSLSLIKTSIEGLSLGKYVYMSNYYTMNKMKDVELQQIEVIALTKLLKN